MLVKNSETDDTENDIEKIQETLQEIKGQEGIIGYILRDQKSAAIDMKDPTKIVDYAMFSATARDVGCNSRRTKHAENHRPC